MTNGKENVIMTSATTTSPHAGRPRAGRGRPRWAHGCAAVLAWVIALGLGAGSAQALTVHESLFSFTGSATPAGAFHFFLTGGLAVDNSSSSSGGDVYVEDGFNKVADRYSIASNAASYLCQITGAGSASTSASECSTSQAGVPQGKLGLDYGQGAVDASGHLWQPDNTAHVLDEFDASGNYLGQVSLPAGANVRAVAVAPSGDVLIAFANVSGVDEYDPNTSTLSTFTTGSTTPTGAFGSSSVTGVAVDDDPSSPAYGDVYVADSSHNVVDVFGSTGTYLSQLTGTAAGSPFASVGQLAVDPTSGDLYVTTSNTGGTVYELSPTGSFITTIALPNSGTTFSVAISASSGDVFVADGHNERVDVYGPGVTAPNVTTGQASSVAQTTASLNGTVNPQGSSATTCEFEYVDDADYNASASDPYSAGQTTSCSPTPPYTSSTSVSASLTGLTPSTTYHFRLDAGNAAATIDGTDATLTTSGPAGVDSETARSVAHTATVTGQINPHGFDTTCALQYVSDSNYRSTAWADATSVPCSPADLGSGFGDQTATASIAGLALSTAYDYRFVATNSAATTDGATQSFTTWGISNFSFSTVNQNGGPYTQAGGHPYELTTDITVNTNPGVAADPSLVSTTGTLRDVLVHLPAGLVGNPNATPRCSDYDVSVFQCRPASQVGVITLYNNQGLLYTDKPIFNVVPPAGVPAEFAAAISVSAEAFITAGVRTGGDYGLDADSINITGLSPVTSIQVTMWGDPASPAFTPERACPIGGNAASYAPPPCDSNVPEVPFLTMPTSCTGPLTASLQVDSYEDPGEFLDASQSLPADTGCDGLDFSPSLSVRPTASSADSPSGLDVDLSMPQQGLSNPSGLAEADLKDATVTLPPGVSVDPSAASGLTACAPDQIGIDNANAPSCPDSSKIGSVEVDSPLLSDPLKGGVYVAQQGNNPFNSLLAIYVTAYADGVWIKLAGHVVADPQTGQLTTTFSNNPQLPFTDFKLDFFGGSQGILATPDQLGTYTTTSDLFSWAGGPDASPSDSFQITSGAVSGFKPSLTAGTQNPQAGAYSPFVLSFQRSDTDQYFFGLAVKLPEGMLAKLAGVGECSGAQLAAAAASTGTAELANPSCPASSQVGTVTTGAGPGPDPYFVDGKAYLTGPYKGAPYGLAVIVPAVAGPYDLGTVVVRQALYVDPTTAQVTAVSDPFPTILQGIPLRIRRIDVDLDRPDFTINPTSCDPTAVGGILSSTGGLATSLSSRFQVGGCAALGFAPKLAMKLSGKGKTSSGDHPTLTATLTQPFGQANLHTARVALPLSMALDPNNSDNVCNYDVAQAVHGGAVGCPANTIVGSASAVTPLLSQPLTGKVYLVQGIRFGKNGQRIHTEPSLLIPLRGQIALDLRAQTSVNGAEQLVTTFSTIPDAAVSKFTLNINGGPKGILVITGRGQTICGSPQVANANFGAQSGKTDAQNVTMSTPCTAHPKKHKTKKHKAKQGQRHHKS